VTFSSSVALRGIALACARSPVDQPFNLKRLNSNVWAAVDNSSARHPAGANAGLEIAGKGKIAA